MSLRRMFGLMLLFLFFEAVVAVVTSVVWPGVSVFLACLGMTGLAVGVWAVFVLLTRVLMRPRVPQAPAQPRPAPIPMKPSFGEDGFAQELGVLIQEANRRLAGTVPLNARREQPTVATLPLFLVIGGESSGKTSAVVNSGLEPRLLAGEASREGTVVPTKLANLWFAEGSVFAEVSGRLLMQESDHWEKALRILTQQSRIPKWKRILLGHRGQPILKGVVLVCDTNMFARANDPQRASAFARTLNERLQVIGAVCRVDFPVYVVFSKCDGVPYFAEFFAHLSEPEGRRPLGVTLPFAKTRSDSADIYSDREAKRLTSYFSRLYMSLSDKRMVLLAREDETRKKSVAYEFPRELKKIRGDVVQFLLDVFRPNPLQQGARLRGFYFTGQRWVARTSAAAAEGTVLEFSVAPKRAEATVFFGAKPQAAGNLAVARAVAAESAIPKWMFLAEVFHSIVLKDRAGYVAPQVNTRDQAYRNLAFGGVGAVLLLMSLLWANSWRHNRELLNTVQSSIEATQRVGPDAINQETLSEMESLRTALVELQDYDRQGAPLSYRWGLYAGNDVLASVHSLYFDRFRRMFMNPMLAVLSARFLSLPSNNPQDDVYDLLKSYRMIVSGACPPDERFLSATLVPTWPSAVATPPELAGLAEKQTQFYVAELKIRDPYKNQITENGLAVTQAQTYLHDLNGPDKIFRALLEQVNRDKQADTLSHYPANYTEVMSGPDSIEAAYTRDGWEAMIDSIRGHKLASAGEACVVGSSSPVSNWTSDAATERDVEELYVKNYTQHWKVFLDAHHIVAFNGAADAARKLQTIADNNRSPLLGLIYMVSHNTNVAAPQSTSEKVGQTIAQTEKSAKQAVSNLLDKFAGNKPQTKPSQTATSANGTMADVQHEFEPVHVMVDPENPEKWLNEKNQAYIKALADLSTAVGSLPAKLDSKDPASQQAVDQANKAVDGANTALQAMGGIFPNTRYQVDIDLKALLKEPITNALRVIRGIPVKVQPHEPTPVELALPVRDRVNAAAQLMCRSVEGLQAKYPFNAMASEEATAQDLNDVFAPATGALAQFSQTPEVSKVYMRQGKTWAVIPTFPLTVSQDFLLELNNLSALSDGLYADGGNSPRFDYTVTLDGTGKVPFELDVDAHMMKFVPGKPSFPTKLVWPPVTGAGTKLILKAGLLKSGTLLAQNSGPWSLFHLLQFADDQSGNLFTFRTVQFAGSSHVPLQDG